MQKFLNWIKSNKAEFFILVLILIIASFFRFYKIYESFYFISDAGRDAQAAFKIIADHKLTLIGPRASVAGFFLGPFYFYLITIPLWFFKMDPIGLAYFSSLLGVLAVFLIYLVAKKMFDLQAGLAASFLYAVSPIVINHSRMAWNPSPIPLFTLLLLLGLAFFGKTKQFRWLTLVWVAMGLGLQLHYSFIYFLPPLVIWLLIIQKDFWIWLRGLVLGLGILLFLNSTLIVFDIRHNFLTSRAFLDFIFGDKVSFTLGQFLINYGRIVNEAFNLTVLSGLMIPLKAILVLGLAALLLAKKKWKHSVYLLLCLFLFSIFFFSFFNETIQLYYYNFLFPFPILLVSCLASILYKRKYEKYLAFLFLFIFFWFNLEQNLHPPRPPRTLEQIRQTTRSIIERVPDSSTFNIAAFADEPWYTAEEYRYFSYYYGKRASGPENYKDIQKLYLVSSKSMDNPLAVKSQETASFDPQRVEDNWMVNSVYVYQLGR